MRMVLDKIEQVFVERVFGFGNDSRFQSNVCSIQSAGLSSSGFMPFFTRDHLEWSNNHFAWIERVFGRQAGLGWEELPM